MSYKTAEQEQEDSEFKAWVARFRHLPEQRDGLLKHWPDEQRRYGTKLVTLKGPTGRKKRQH